MQSVEVAASWPAANVAVAVVSSGGVAGSLGDQQRVFPLASVTKLLTSYAVLVAVEEGAVEWDQPAGPPGATVRHLISHTAGYAFDKAEVQAEPGTRRIYSNAGFDVLAAFVEAACEMPFATYLHEAVFVPLGMKSSALVGSAGAGAESCAADLALFAAELLAPSLVSSSLVREATSAVFPGLNGVLPGYGMQKPNDWGLGFEIRAGKSPHWTGNTSSPRTFGHFGQSGTFLWVDPEISAACVALTDLRFGPWAVEAWTPFSDGVRAELVSRRA
ncbi:CubicO group peptidase, beta-lactamase class C family [Lentzea xinjiangensis]|uniref:CubicO group peptidase, beta-lactamase class C family n=1 Tax=Lentzea xinjiangensis TaxID=402600 RepID=A0A1H9FDH6_9PSEU|nr:serine hydrolase domain-containing protein [Lentzea xinjiangensis]SEQ35378.1 CubicO group peptidase, beta-lactamase class C family [Lentzea xinjiangensis]